jgi:hypothetical protein
MMHNFFRGLDSNSPDAYPARHWELGDDGQPTNRIIDSFHHVTRVNDRLRRVVSPVAPRPREGPLTEPTAGVQPWPRERVLMPRSRPSRQRKHVPASGASRSFSGPGNEWLPPSAKPRTIRSCRSAGAVGPRRCGWFVPPVAVAKQAFVELSGRQARQLNLKVDRPRHLLPR